MDNITLRGYEQVNYISSANSFATCLLLDDRISDLDLILEIF